MMRTLMKREEDEFSLQGISQSDRVNILITRRVELRSYKGLSTDYVRIRNVSRVFYDRGGKSDPAMGIRALRNWDGITD